MMNDNKMNDDAMMKPDAMVRVVPPKVDRAGSYMTYAQGVLEDGKTKVLFFHAAWCPTCKVADTDLTAWYGAHEYANSTYKLDYDTETALRAKYRVVRQHTFVLVDGQGNALKVIEGPTDAQLQTLLQA